jgi:hypothetical protein
MFYRRLTHDDIVSAAAWAKANCGEDDPVDVLAHRLLEHMRNNHGGSVEYHEKTRDKCEALATEIEERFKVEPEEGGAGW